MPNDTSEGATAVAVKNRWVCPMCGEPGKRTKEHVWGQWLRQHNCVKSELAKWHGERLERPQQFTTMDEDGRYRTDIGSLEQVATFLPQVTVQVCASCNTGWMSALEQQVKRQLAPWVFSARAVRLRAEEQQSLAIWAVKTFMTYVLTRPAQGNPFTQDEYEAMARLQTPPARAHVWMYASSSPRSACGLGISSFVVSDGTFDPVAESDNAAFGFLAAGHAMFLMVLLPPQAPNELLSAYAPPEPAHPALMRRISAPDKGWLFPAGRCDDAHMDAVMSWMNLPEHTGLPFDGLTRGQMRQAHSEFIAGAELDQLRTSYGRGREPRVAHPKELKSLSRNARAEAQRLTARGEHQAAGQGLVTAATEHIEARAWQEALALLEEAMSVSEAGMDTDAAVVADQGMCLTELRRWPEACEAHQRAIDLGYDTPHTRGDLADALTQCGRYADALAVLETQPLDLDVPELPRAELMRAALTHLVHDLGIERQERGNVSDLQDDLDTLADSELRALLVGVDALAQRLWARREEAEESAAYWVARALFGGRAHHWFEAAVALHRAGMENSGRRLIRLAFEGSGEMIGAFPSNTAAWGPLRVLAALLRRLGVNGPCTLPLAATASGMRGPASTSRAASGTKRSVSSDRRARPIIGVWVKRVRPTGGEVTQVEDRSRTRCADAFVGLSSDGQMITTATPWG